MIRNTVRTSNEFLDFILSQFETSNKRARKVRSGVRRNKSCYW